MKAISPNISVADRNLFSDEDPTFHVVLDPDLDSYLNFEVITDIDLFILNIGPAPVYSSLFFPGHL